MKKSVCFFFFFLIYAKTIQPHITYVAKFKENGRNKGTMPCRSGGLGDAVTAKNEAHRKQERFVWQQHKALCVAVTKFPTAHRTASALHERNNNNDIDNAHS